MQASAVRNRIPPAPESRSMGGQQEQSSSSGYTSTPTSTIDEKQVQAYRLVSLARAVWRGIARFGLGSLPRPDPEEVRRFNEDHGYDRLKYERIDPYPEGYPQLAALMYCDDTFANIRSFGLLSIRILLQLQTEITELEKEMHELDKADAASPTQNFRLRGSEHYSGWTTAQQDLLSKIRLKWNEYADVAIKQSQMRSLGRTTPRNHLQLLNWIMNKKPLKKYDFIFHAEDFVSLAKQSEKDRFFEDWIESKLDNKPHSHIIKNFLRTQKERDRTEHDYVDIYSPLRLSILARILTVFFTVGSLLVPVFLLFLLPMSREWMATVALVFVLIFSLMMSAMTGARLQDMLYGTASFAAVLVAILGNVNQGAGPGSGSQ